MAKEIEQELSAIPTDDNITEAKYEELETK
jgi:hypothetical protein